MSVQATRHLVGPMGAERPSDLAANPKARRSVARSLVSLVAVVGVVAAGHLLVRDTMLSRATVIAGACMVLWLTEAVPLYATTLLLWVSVTLLLGPLGPEIILTPPRTFGGQQPGDAALLRRVRAFRRRSEVWD